MNDSLIIAACKSAFDPILVLDRHGLIQFASAQIETLSGRASEALRDRPLAYLLPPRLQEFSVRFLTEYFAAPTPRYSGWTPFSTRAPPTLSAASAIAPTAPRRTSSRKMRLSGWRRVSALC